MCTATKGPYGKLYLVPTPLDFGCTGKEESRRDVGQWLPEETIGVAASLSHWITENAKSTRAFLKRIQETRGIAAPLQEQQITELPREAHKKGDHTDSESNSRAARDLLAPALGGHDIGLVSEAGMPAIADPGSSVVRAAHALGVDVIPLTGPVSLMLALAASGLNGQSFAFVGYVPSQPDERIRRLKNLDAHVLKSGQTQILIETPYRNTALLQCLIQTLQPQTRLAVSCGLHQPTPATRSAPIAQWRDRSIGKDLPLDLPTVFLMGR
ncbi:MAG: SAM-dependent methyltransferase [Burkholderiaceae bacterium]